VLIAGGYGRRPEVYDPATNRWSATGAAAPRTHPVVLRLHDGSVLLAAGQGLSNRDLSSARILDPSTASWTTTGSLHKERNTAVGAILPDGRVLIAGGQQATGHVLRSAEVYDPSTRRWSTTGGMRTPRDAAVSITMPDGRVLACGGMNYSGVLAGCEFYHP
jgi:N-acetylneuraminic acid mutarotase